MNDLTPTHKHIITPPHSTENTELLSELEQPTNLRGALIDGRTFSFQQPPMSKLQDFCLQFLNMYAIDKMGKRMIDPNVTLLNSTQKQIVQTIVETNINRNDDKSKFLTQRAQKFLKILWKAEKYSDACCEQPKQKKAEKQVPNYASPIHNFKKPKLNTNNSFGTFSNKSHKTDRSISRKSNVLKSPRVTNPIVYRPSVKLKEQQSISFRSRQYLSQDHKFERIRLSPKIKQAKQKQAREKSFEIDLRENVSVVQTTISRTKQFQNMLKILRHKKE